MSSPSVTQSWAYDTRGRVTQANDTIDGLTGSRTIQTTYDAADRVKTMTYPSGEQVTYTYDAGGRQASLYSNTYGVTYAQGTTFDALDQPLQWTFGNGLVARWTYTEELRRLATMQLGILDDPDIHFRSDYTYDKVGNVSTIQDKNEIGAVRETQTFGYDHRDRLISASAGGFGGGPTSYNRTYSYNAIGNLLSKDGRNYRYTSVQPGGAQPHAATCANWTGSCAAADTYTYDANGNVKSGGGRTFTWSAENQPKSVIQSGVTESYLYNADNERVSKTSNGTTTFYFGGGMAEETGTTKRHAYTLNGQVVAERDVPASGPSTFRYLHGDHLGSVSASSTSGSSPTVTRQYFTPWGEARFGNLTATTERNYTGQRKDDTGLLFYNARYYDPKLSRFISPDTIVPGMASGKGGMGNIGVDSSAASTLTVDFHEGQFAAGVGAENAFTREYGFDFESSEEGTYQGGPPNPQALNRYSYVLNNPLKYTDPTGHYLIEKVTGGGGGGGGCFLCVFLILAKSPWLQKATDRGVIIEKALGRNLTSSFPTIDRWRNGIATSIKSIDFNTKSYMKIAKFSDRIKEWIRELSRYSGTNGRTYGDISIRGSEIKGRVLELAIPPNASPAYREALKKLQKYASERGVRLDIVVVY